MKLKNIKSVNFKDKDVLLRLDLDVPLINGRISDDMRLQLSIETIDYLLPEAKTVIIIGHLGRPSGEDQNFTLLGVGEWYAKNFKFQISNLKLNDFTGWKIGEKLILLENLRFFKEEEENDSEFSKKLASLADIYINDAFASSHRAHASIVGITKYLPSYAGFRFLKEVEVLSKVLESPKRPLAVLIGGAKIETKLPLVEKMHVFADYVMVGGEIAENDKVLLKIQHEQIKGSKSALLVADLNEEKNDITLKSLENFIQIAQKCQTIVWNGPMGFIENPKDTNHATLTLAKELAKVGSYTIVGGGDTVGFLRKNKLSEKFSFISTGGGAMLEFLARVKLPGLTALEK